MQAAIQLIEGPSDVIVGIASLHIDDEQAEQLRVRYPCIQAAPDL